MGSEVLIIGGGVIGLSIARELVKRGVGDITLVERHSVGAEASWAAAGMLSPNIEAVESDDFHHFGTESLQMYAEFSASLLEETGIDVELDQTGTLCLAFEENEALSLYETYQQQNENGVAVERLTGEEIRDREPAISRTVLGGLFYRNDWQVDNRRLLEALRRSADESGVKILENCEVSELLLEAGRVTGARSAKGDLRANVTIVATGAWTSLIKIAGAAMPFGVKPIRGQMISFQPDEKVLRHVVYSRRGYLVPRHDGRVLVGATVEDAGFDRSITVDAASNLRIAAAEIVPALGEISITDHWAGLRPLADGLPIIGETPGYDGALVATAHYRNGILLAPLTAKILSDKIVDGAGSEYFRTFGAQRFSSMLTNATGG